MPAKAGNLAARTDARGRRHTVTDRRTRPCRDREKGACRGRGGGGDR